MNNRMKDIGVWIVAALPFVLLIVSMPVAWAYWVDRIWGFFIVGFFTLSILGWLAASLFRFLRKAWRKIRQEPSPPSHSPISSTASDATSAEIDALLLYNYNLPDEPQNLSHSDEPDLTAQSSAKLYISPKPSDAPPIWLLYAICYFIAAVIHLWIVGPIDWIYIARTKFIQTFIMNYHVGAILVGAAFMILGWSLRRIGGFLFDRMK